MKEECFDSLQLFPSSVTTDEFYGINNTLEENDTSTMYNALYAKKFHKYDHYKADCEQWHGVPVGTGCDTPPYKADVFFLSCILFMGTFVLSMGLKTFRNTRFLPNKVRLFLFESTCEFCSVSLLQISCGFISLNSNASFYIEIRC